jgi:hypothetical protein
VFVNPLINAAHVDELLAQLERCAVAGADGR